MWNRVNERKHLGSMEGASDRIIPIQTIGKKFAS